MMDWVMREAERRRMTISQLEEATEISTVSEMYYGHRPVNIDHWLKFLKVFGFPLRAGLDELADLYDQQHGLPRERSREFKAAGTTFTDDGALTLKQSGAQSDNDEVSAPRPTSRASR